MTTKEKKCCLCGEKIIGFGNNAEPLGKDLCSDDCNLDVIFERVKKKDEDAMCICWHELSFHKHADRCSYPKCSCCMFKEKT